MKKSRKTKIDDKTDPSEPVMIGRSLGDRAKSFIKILLPPVFLLVRRKVRRVMGYPAAKRRLAGQTKLHLACGHHIPSGWANIDLQKHPSIIQWDLADPLPVASGTVEYIFCEAYIEHITLEQAGILLSECHRLLKAGGVFRINTPCMEDTIRLYLSGDCTSQRDVGFNPATPCQMVNEMFRSWDHRFIYDIKELSRLCREAGYRRVTQVAWHKSTHPELRDLECRPFHNEIIIEATK